MTTLNTQSRNTYCTAYLLLGSNLGNRLEYLQKARGLVSQIKGVDLTGTSSIYESAAEDMSVEENGENAGDFLNQALATNCQISAMELLQKLEGIELQLGRISKGAGFSRVIDIDILLFGGEVRSSERLTIPHRRLNRRGFALAPLLELEPTLKEPTSGAPYCAMFTDALREKVKVYRDHATIV